MSVWTYRVWMEKRMTQPDKNRFYDSGSINEAELAIEAIYNSGLVCEIDKAVEDYSHPAWVAAKLIADDVCVRYDDSYNDYAQGDTV